MPEEFLDLPEGSAAGLDSAGHRVTKTVGVHAVQAGQPSVPEDDIPHARPMQCRQRRQGADEHRPFTAISATDSEVVHQRFTDVDGHRED